MRRLVDMNNKKEAGFADWEFIHDMQGLVPDLITPEMIQLNREFINHIPEKWKNIKKQLAGHLDLKGTVYIAISDMENLGNEFKIRGYLQDKDGEHLAFHRVVLYDKDRFNDDYLGAVITDKDGKFTLEFGKKVFSDFGLEAEPDVYLKIFRWNKDRFEEKTEVTPEVFEKTETQGGHIIMEYGTIII